MSKLSFLAALAALALLVADPSLAQEAGTAADPAAAATEAPAASAEEAPAAPASPDPAEHTAFILNTLLFLIGGFLVFFMAAGFCMLEAGLVRSKNVAMQCTKNISLFSVAAIGYYLVGFNLMYPAGSWFDLSALGLAGDGYLSALIAPTVLEDVGVAADNVGDISYASVGSDFFFQLMFCAATASIVSGALAERIKLWPFLIFTFILTAVIYPIQGAWKWGGGFLDAQFAFQDFAGSTVVHSVGGWAALAGALILGARKGKYAGGRVNPMPGSSLPLATLGTFILWLGWFGFNGGSQLAMGTVGDVADVSRIFANTNAAAAGGVVAAVILTQLLYGKVDLTMALNGCLAGLVSITAEPLEPSIGWATLVGAVGGVIVVITVPLLDRLRIDDVVGAIPVHLFAGIWGTMIVVASNENATLQGQAISIAIVAAFVFVVSAVIWFLLAITVGIRANDDDETRGLDESEIGMEAYPEFGKGSQFV